MTSYQAAHIDAWARNPTHTSHTDSRPHATVLLATEDQANNNKSHTVHIYHDENGNYTGHSLYPERQNKTTDNWTYCFGIGAARGRSTIARYWEQALRSLCYIPSWIKQCCISVLRKPTKANMLTSFVQLNIAVYDSASDLAAHTINNTMSLSLVIPERVGTRLSPSCR